METYNCLTKIFRKERDIHETDSCQDFSIRLVGQSKRNRQYDMPQTDEIAGLIMHISDMHPLFMTLQYPILFPYGQSGFNENIPVTNTDGNQRKREYITKRELFSYQLQTRLDEGMVIVSSKRLLHQYIVDAYTCIEMERLLMNGDTDARSLGKRVILPSSFRGSPRYMDEKYHDAMAICRWHGNPDLFITITTNPKWDEITDHLKMYGSDDPNDRPDLEARVFKMKLDELISDFNRGTFFPRPKAVVYTIEFQKQGLPHAHILLWLEGDFRTPTASDIDRIISAELPDKEKDPEAYALVEQHMMHDPCGKDRKTSPCMEEGVCSKKFPRGYVTHTQINDSGYVLYRLRNTERFVYKGDIKLDSQYVVPHNIQILKKYKAHVNVEWCNKSSAIKYLFKYITKGVDRATFKLQPNAEQSTLLEKEKEKPRNEINEFVEGRYLSACESTWRIFKFDIHHNTPAVQKLPVHLPGEQTAIFDEDEDLEDVETRYLHGRTMLTEWFEMNRLYEEVRKLKYIEMLTMFVWDNSQKIYTKRKQKRTIGRIVNISPAAGDKYYLGILVSLLRGPTGYDDLYTVGDIKYETFQEACYARGLLGSDKDWHDSMSEASQFSSPRSLRYLFVLILVFCQVSEPKKLWDHSWQDMAEDVLMHQRRLLRFPALLQLTPSELQHYTLIEIESLLQNFERSLNDFTGMPLPNKAIMDEMKKKAMARHNQFDIAEETMIHQSLFDKLNHQQRAVYDAVTTSVNENQGKLFFLYGAGGRGKTFLYKTIIAALRSTGKKVIPVASSSIAALLLPGGRTAHSRFSIPLKLYEDTYCEVKTGTVQANFLSETDLIIWDEAPMAHRHAFEAVDRTLKDILAVSDATALTKPFGGKTVLLGGDFRQILPVIPQGTRQETVSAALNRSPLWKYCDIFHLTQNMRVEPEEKAFADWILKVGDGRAAGEP
ncbi:unnamed protein product [Brassica oleracea var. botrytis]